MADITKATININEGIIQLEGSEQFVEKYLDQFKNTLSTTSKQKPRTITQLNEQPNKAPVRKRQKKTTGPSPKIIELLSEGYFKEPRTRAEVQQALLEQKGSRFQGREVSATLVNYFSSGKLKRTGAGSKAKYYAND